MTDGKILRLVVDDEPFDVRYGHLRAHECELDLRGGVLRREVGWVSPAGKAVHISSVRLVSFVHRGVAAIRYVVEPVGATRASSCSPSSSPTSQCPLRPAIRGPPRR